MHTVLPVQDAVDQLVEEDEQLQSRIEQLDVQKAENEDKLRRKQAERERMEQRLMQMKHVSAPYQEEVDTVFQELQRVSSVFLAKFRTLEYLEEELGKIRKFASEWLQRIYAVRVMDACFGLPAQRLGAGVGSFVPCWLCVRHAV